MELNQSLESLITTDNRLCTKKVTHLEKWLLIILSFGVCVIIACLLNISIRLAEDQQVCTTRSCIKKAGEILKQVDINVNPCTDFFRFACGKMIDTTHEKQAPHQILKNQIEKQLHILLEPIEESDHPIINYQKKLFKACINETEGDKSFEIFKDILKEFSGWAVVEGDAWDEDKFDLIDVIGKLRRNGLEFSSIVAISLPKAPSHKKHKIIKVDFPYTVRKRDYLYTKLMVNVAVIFGANKTRAETEMAQVYDFITTVEKSREDQRVWSEGDLHEVTHDKLYNLQQAFPDTDWIRLINIILQPVTKVDDQDVVVFPTPKFLHTYLNFLNKTSKRVLCNYVLWHAIEDLLPLLSYELQELHNYDNCLSGTPRISSHDECKLAIKRNFGPIPAYLAYAKKHLTKETREKAEDIYKRIKFEFASLLKKLPINVENQKKVEKTFDSLGAIFGIKEKRVDNALYDKFFKGDLKSVEDNGFLRTYLHFKWKVENIWIENVHITNMSISDLLVYYQIPRTEAMYINEENAIDVPVGMLHNLFYEGDKLMLSHFATIGKNIAVVLVNIFNDLDIRGENDKELWSEIIETKCTGDHKFNEDDLIEDHYEKLRISEQIGLKTAYKAYKKWAEENEDEYAIIGIDYKPNQLFWIASMSELCLEDDLYTKSLHEKNLGVRQNSDFVNDFQCSSDATMNLSGKCNYFENV